MNALAAYAVCALGIALGGLWLYFRVRWVRAVNRLPRRSAPWRSFLLADLKEFWHAPNVPGTDQPDALPLLARYAASLRQLGHGLGVIWLFNPYVLPFARPVVLLWNPELTKEVLQPQNYGKFEKGSFYKMAEPLLGKGVLSANDGPTWTCQRHLAQQGMNPKVFDDLVSMVAAALDGVFTSWDQLAEKGEPVRVQAPLRRLTLGVFGRLALNFDLAAPGADGEPAICRALDCALGVLDKLGRASPLLRPYLRGERLAAALGEVDAVAGNVIGNHKSTEEGQPGRGDLLGHLMWALQGPEGRQPVLGEQLVLDNVKTFLLVGHDTAASSLAWALWLLATHRAVQGRLQEEVDAFFEAAGASGEVLDCAAFRKLSLLDAVVKETLRLYPPMAIARAPTCDVKLGPTSGGSEPYIVPQGCDVLVLPYLVHRDPGLWPRPDAFEPERWMQKEAPAQPCAYLPFGFGRRSCMGQEFAMTEMRTALAYVVHRYTLRPDSDSPEPRPVMRVMLAASPFSLHLDRRSAGKA